MDLLRHRRYHRRTFSPEALLQTTLARLAFPRKEPSKSGHPHVGTIIPIPPSRLASGGIIPSAHHPWDMASKKAPFRFSQRPSWTGVLPQGMLCGSLFVRQGSIASGAGLVTIFCEESIAPAMSIKAPDEIMVYSLNNLDNPQLFQSLNALAIGPGLGSGTNSTSEKLGDLLERLLKSPLPSDYRRRRTSSSPVVICFQLGEIVCLPSPGRDGGAYRKKTRN